jgi:phosphomevalonate kinase
MQHGVVYKPCGAGGGDIGAAFSTDPAALDRFTRTAHIQGYAPIMLETALHGIHVGRD